MNEAIPAQQTSQRLLSLDVLRGLIMVLLMMESTGLYENLYENTMGQPFNLFFTQLVHHPWNGLHFWDLIQPAFMFMAGTAMALSLHKQWANGLSWTDSFKKILRRCGWLFFLGRAGLCGSPIRPFFWTLGCAYATFIHNVGCFSYFQMGLQNANLVLPIPFITHWVFI